MGIFGKLFGKRKKMEREEGAALERILEKMGIPRKEIADFKSLLDSEDLTRLADLADELVSRERSRAAGAKKVDISPWGAEQISEMLRIMMKTLSKVGHLFPAFTELMLRISTLTSGGEGDATLWFLHIQKAVENVIREDLKKPTEEDIRRWQSKKW